MAVSVLEPKGHQISYIKPLLIIILWGTVTARQTCRGQPQLSRQSLLCTAGPQDKQEVRRRLQGHTEDD